MANNDVQHLLDMLYEMIDGAKNAPLTSDKCILNRDEALDLLDEIRAQATVVRDTADCAIGWNFPAGRSSSAQRRTMSKPPSATSSA